jgi:PPOX class probable F420-dependent enzyme
MPLVPDALSRSLVMLAKRPMTSSMSPKAATVLDRPVRHTDFSSLEGHHHVLLVTYKRDGTPVPAPVWFARDGEQLFVWTEVNAYKAKRLRRDPRALIAACSPLGVPLEDPIAATGRVLTDEAERAHAAEVIRNHWGLARRLFELTTRPVTDVHYLAFVPSQEA